WAAPLHRIRPALRELVARRSPFQDRRAHLVDISKPVRDERLCDLVADGLRLLRKRLAVVGLGERTRDLACTVHDDLEDAARTELLVSLCHGSSVLEVETRSRVAGVGLLDQPE